MEKQEKLNVAVKLAQSYILLYLKKYMPQDKIDNIEKLFADCPVILKTLDNKPNEFGQITNIGGITEKDKIIIKEEDIEKTNINNERELNKIVGTIIHEYAHKIRALNNPYEEMLEESFASIFAEVCINNAKMNYMEKEEKTEPFEMLNSIHYQKYESQIRALLYVLKEHALDEKAIAEYVAGDMEDFKQLCTQSFGILFHHYFDSISSKENEASEQILIELITTYIQKNGLNIKDYWEKKDIKDNLYFKGSPTLAKAIVHSGIDKFSIEDQEYFKYYESSVQISNQNDNFIKKEKIDNIKNMIETNYSLKEKNIDEIKDTIIDLCSSYIQNQKKDSEEAKIFINELTLLIPNIEDFKNKFIQLRIAGQENKIFDDLDLEHISYSDIYKKINELLKIEKEENIKR